jgi:hypothetical protein
LQTNFEVILTERLVLLINCFLATVRLLHIDAATWAGAFVTLASALLVLIFFPSGEVGIASHVDLD